MRLHDDEHHSWTLPNLSPSSYSCPDRNNIRSYSSPDRDNASGGMDSFCPDIDEGFVRWMNSPDLEDDALQYSLSFGLAGDDPKTRILTGDDYTLTCPMDTRDTETDHYLYHTVTHDSADKDENLESANRNENGSSCAVDSPTRRVGNARSESRLHSEDVSGVVRPSRQDVLVSESTDSAESLEDWSAESASSSWDHAYYCYIERSDKKPASEISRRSTNEEQTMTHSDVDFSRLSPQDGSFRCPVAGCGKTYGRRSHLQAHARRHSGERPYLCRWEGCKWRFSRSDELVRHMRSHSGDRPYSCDQCAKRFSRSDHLKKHLRVHSKKGNPRRVVHKSI